MSSLVSWTALAFAAVASSSALYTWIWYRPEAFIKLLAKQDDPCRVMAFWAHCLKLVQFLSIIYCTNWTAARNLTPLQAVFATAFVIAGQHLNGLVYKHLGVDGVYYGARFGKSIPWVHAYPYSAMRDPQYIGCILTLIGLSVIIPMDITLWWIANYFYLMWVESTPPNTVSPTAAATVTEVTEVSS